MKLKVLFLLIIVYVISGFGWWSYSLIKFSNDEYKLKLQLLEKSKQTCEFKIVEEARALKFNSDNADSLKLNGASILADTSLLSDYLKTVFQGSFIIQFKNAAIGEFSILVNPMTKRQLEKELQLKKRSFAAEAILLTILIALGIFGVYYSVNFIYDLNKQQNNFLLSVTHELKTPIAAVKLIGETMMRRSLPPEKQTELMGVILENADRLQDMTENMLTAMQMESNKYDIRTEELDLTEIALNAQQHFSLKNKITGEIEPGITYFGDPVLLKMTINNLLENAIKYSDNQPVEFNLRKTSNSVIIQVKDTGIGIDPAMRKKVFKRFYRIQDDETRETKGSGLGLFIVKQAVEKHRGKIKIEDNIPHGTIFTISFQAMDF